MSPDIHVQGFFSPAGSRRPKVLLRNTADISHLIAHLFTHWTTPRIEICTDGLPTLDVQRAQHRIVRLSDACNCLLGELLATTILLGGSYFTWTLNQGWRHLGQVAVAALCVGLIGKALNVAWTRLRLLLVLRRLRHQLGTGTHLVKVATDRPAGAGPANLPVRGSLQPLLQVRAAVEDHDAEAAWHAQQPLLANRPKRPRVLLRDAADIERLIPHLLTHRTLPRIEISAGAHPALDVQRAQHHIVRLSNGCNCVLGGLFAATTLLSGSFYVVLISNYNWDWTTPKGWGSMGLVLVFVLCATLIGWATEVAWTRVRLVLLLRRLRSRIGTSSGSDNRSTA
jgi:hypothetical protein